MLQTLRTARASRADQRIGMSISFNYVSSPDFDFCPFKPAAPLPPRQYAHIIDRRVRHRSDDRIAT